jgi:hypothetical protein
MYNNSIPTSYLTHGSCLLQQDVGLHWPSWSPCFNPRLMLRKAKYALACDTVKALIISEGVGNTDVIMSSTLRDVKSHNIIYFNICTGLFMSRLHELKWILWCVSKVAGDNEILNTSSHYVIFVFFKNFYFLSPYSITSSLRVITVCSLLYKILSLCSILYSTTC